MTAPAAAQEGEQTEGTVPATTEEPATDSTSSAEVEGEQPGTEEGAEPEAEPKPEAEPLTVTLDADEEEDEPPPSEKAAHRWKEIKADAKAKAQRIRELESQIAAAKPASQQESAPTLPPRPKSSDPDVDYDEEKLAAKMERWTETKKRVEAHAEKQKAVQEMERKRLSGIAEDYRVKKEAFVAKVPNYADVETNVARILNPAQQGALVEAVDDAPKFILALHQNPKQAAALAAIPSLIKFTAEAVKMEKAMTTKGTSKGQLTAEKKITGGGATSTSNKLEALEKEAERTKDRTAVIRYKEELKRIEEGKTKK